MEIGICDIIYHWSEVDNYMSDFENIHREKFTQQEWEIIQDFDHSLLIKGDALSGKTHTFLGRIAYLTQVKDISLHRMLNIAKDTKSCEEAMSRYRQGFHEEEELPSFTTIYAFAYRIIKRYTKLKETEAAKPYRNLQTIMKRIGIDKFGVELRYGELEELSQKISYVKAMMLSQKEIDEIICSFVPFPAFFKAYEAMKKKQNVMDYEDLITQALTLIMNDTALREHYQQIYRFIHIDQAETLSFAAHLLIKALTAPETKLVMFANPSLAMCKEGAYPKGLDTFTSTYNNSKELLLAQSDLSENRKAVLSLLSKELTKEDWHGQDDELVCKAFADPSRLYTYAKKQVIQQENCVFAYRHPAFALPLIDDLAQSNIGAIMEGDVQSFYADPLIQELLDFIRLMIDPKDASIFARVYQVFEVSEKTAKEILEMMRDEEMDVFEALIRSSLKSARKKELMSQMELIRILPNKESIIIIKGILSRLGYDRRLKKLNVRHDDAHLIVLKTMAQRYPDPVEFTNRMKELSTLTLDYETRIKILPVNRIHSKRYDRIYVLDCVMSSFPSPYAAMEDERVLFANCLRYGTHIELFGFRTVYDMRTEISSFVFEVHKKKDDQKPVVRTVKKIQRISECHLKPKTRIQHETLGLGMIESVKDGMMHVHFDSEEERSLNIKFCLNNDLIKLA